MIRRKETGLPGTRVERSPRASPNKTRSINNSLERTLDNKIEVAILDTANQGGLPALKQAKSKREIGDLQRLRLSKGIQRELGHDKYRSK